MIYKTKLHIDSKCVQTEDILSSNIDDEVVMMSMDTDKYYGLDPIGSRIWKLLQEPCTLRQVCEKLVMEFQVDASTCQHDVLEFIQKLADAQLVMPVD